MREIKFRVWDGVDSVMWLPDNRRFGYITKTMGNKSLSQPLGYFLDRGHPLMQYTGLYDKNGKEIYEFDIVEYDDVTSDAHIFQTGEKTKGIITWIEGRCQLMPQDIQENHKGGHYISNWDFTQDMEVIGNIWENPELLEK